MSLVGFRLVCVTLIVKYVISVLINNEELPPFKYSVGLYSQFTLTLELLRKVNVTHIRCVDTGRTAIFI